MTWSLNIENIAGIRSGSATVKPGVNAVRGSNWQGKSSFVKAIKTAMGTDKTLTEGESYGCVCLETPKEEIEVELERHGSTISRKGTPYLTDEYTQRCANLFAFLDESNGIRQAVRNDEPLEPILTEPLEFENIDDRIADLKHEREQVERERERASEASDRVPSLEREIKEIEAELEELRDRRSTFQSSETDQDDIESLRTQLSDARSEKSHVEDLIQRTEDTIERTQEKLNQRYEELKTIEVPETTDIQSDIAEVQDELSELERDKELLESLYSVNSRILEEDRLELLGEVEHGLLDDAYTCWVCGNETEQSEIDERLETIREKIDSLSAKVKDRRERVETLQKRRDEQEQVRKRKHDIQQDIQRLEDTLNDREDSLKSAKERYDVLADRVDELESTVEESDEELASIESEIKYQETKREELRDELSSCRSEAERLENLKTEREKLSAEIEELRNRKNRIRAETRESFDQAISDVIQLFDTSFESAHLTGNFDLVIARNGREVSLNALSEGEVELLGIITALAGYEAHDVEMDTSVMVLDGLGGLADENLSRLVDYLQERTEYLIMTAYPENTSIGGWEIDPNDWTVVSDQSVQAA